MKVVLIISLTPTTWLNNLWRRERADGNSLALILYYEGEKCKLFGHIHGHIKKGIQFLFSVSLSNSAPQAGFEPAAL